MKLVDQSLQFIRLAERDAQVFYILKPFKEVHLSNLCFNAQQAVEKSLKAVLIYHKKECPRTHDLYYLASTVSENLGLPLDIEEIIKLNPYAVVFRYDDTDIEILSRDEAETIMNTILEWAKDIIQA